MAGTGSGIGIVGAGVGGLHLGLLLRQYGIPATIYTDKTPDQLVGGRLMNTVVHHHHTRVRERALGVNYWDGLGAEYDRALMYLGGEQPLLIRGDLARPSIGVDYRIYLSTIRGEFERRGGVVVVGTVGADDLAGLSERHDPVAVASGRGSLTELFPRVAQLSPYDRPQRILCAGYYRGIASAPNHDLTFSIAPGHGEVIEGQFHSFDGLVTVLTIEAIPGGDQELLARLRPGDDQAGFERAMLDMLRRHHPTIYARVDPRRFGLTRPQDILQGALTPTVRRSYALLGNGRPVIAVGDIRAVVDPIAGQGANAASYSAWTLGQAIVEHLVGQDSPFDEGFCRGVEARTREYLESVSAWSNAMLQPPAPHVIDLMVAMAQNKVIADEFITNFGHPVRQWGLLATPERTAAFLGRYATLEQAAD